MEHFRLEAEITLSVRAFCRLSPVASRTAILCLAALAGPGCAALHQTVLHEVTWEPPAFHEVSRNSQGLALRVEDFEGERWVVVSEQFECVEEALVRGVEVEDRKPKDWVLAAGALLGGVGTSAGLGLLGSALTSGLISEARNGQQSGVSQAVGVGVGIAGALGQLLLTQKIIEGLNSIRYHRERPVTQELGRKVSCSEKVLQRLRLAEPESPPAALHQSSAPRT